MKQASSPVRTTSQRRRAYRGPRLLRAGFRPFFLGAAVWAMVAMAFWLASLGFDLRAPSGLTMLEWHSHEMVFGYTYAVIVGYLLTITPNRTGRFPVLGAPIAGLWGLWIAGRGAVFWSGSLPEALVWGLDMGLALVMVLLIVTEHLANRSWRNLAPAGLLGVLLVADVLFHLEVGGQDFGGLGLRLGVAVPVFLIGLVGGRLVPSFTRNWMVQTGDEFRPAPFGGFDKAAVAVMAVAMVVFVSGSSGASARIAYVMAACVVGLRLLRWGGWRTVSEPMLLMLHLGYLCIALGFASLAIGFDRIPHAWTAGAIGLMTMAMMARTALSHSGQKSVASPWLTRLFALLVAAVVVRVLAEIWPSLSGWAMAGLLWMAAFAGFVLAFWPTLVRQNR